jgi:hypothetical protein
MKARGLWLVGIAFIATRLSIAGCDDAGSHIYTGAQYDPTLGCLDPLTSVDIVTGPEPLNPCKPVCILSLPQDGGELAYVSTMCAPYPLYPYELDASTDPLCVAALEAFARDALCIDGGLVLPPGEDSGVDAGTDADASIRDASDASMDATQTDATSSPDATTDATTD